MGDRQQAKRPFAGNGLTWWIAPVNGRLPLFVIVDLFGWLIGRNGRPPPFNFGLPKSSRLQVVGDRQQAKRPFAGNGLTWWIAPVNGRLPLCVIVDLFGWLIGRNGRPPPFNFGLPKSNRLQVVGDRQQAKRPFRRQDQPT